MHINVCVQYATRAFFTSVLFVFAVTFQGFPEIMKNVPLRGERLCDQKYSTISCSPTPLVNSAHMYCKQSTQYYQINP